MQEQKHGVDDAVFVASNPLDFQIRARIHTKDHARYTYKVLCISIIEQLLKGTW